MKCIVNRAEILRALSHASNVVERQNTIPIVANVLLQAEAGQLRVTATDLDLQMSLTVPAEIEEEGSLTVSATLAHGIMREIEEGAQVSLALVGNKLEIRSGRSKFSLQTLPANDFPHLRTEEMPTSFTLPAKTLADMLKRVEYAQSKEVARYHICCVCLQRRDDKLFAVATNGHLLAWSTCAAPEGSEGFKEALLGGKLVGKLLKLIEEEEGDVTLHFSERLVRIEIGSSFILSKLVDATFPDWMRAVPAGNDKRLRLDRDAMLAAIRRSTVVADNRTRIAKFDLSRDKLTITMASQGNDTAVEETPANYEAADLTVHFNTRYLMDTLGVIDADELQIDLLDAAAPALFTHPNDASANWVVMPFAA